MITDFTKTWWSTRHDHWGVAPSESDHPDPLERIRQTGWRAVLKHDVLCPCQLCQRHFSEERIVSTGRVFHTEFGWEALALLDEELTEANR